MCRGAGKVAGQAWRAPCPRLPGHVAAFWTLHMPTQAWAWHPSLLFSPWRATSSHCGDALELRQDHTACVCQIRLPIEEFFVCRFICRRFHGASSGRLGGCGGVAALAWDRPGRPAAGRSEPLDALLRHPHLRRPQPRSSRREAGGQFPPGPRRTLRAERRCPPGLFVSGDCAFLRGNPGDYAVLLDLVKPIRAAGVPLHMVLGNHDQRENFSQVLLRDAGGAGPSPVTGKLVSVLETPLANWFLLDSLDKTAVTAGAARRSSTGSPRPLMPGRGSRRSSWRTITCFTPAGWRTATRCWRC